MTDAIRNQYECVIGLEVHAELKTGTKIFCRCKTDFGESPNTNICPVCMGYPGTLPVLNEKAVEFAVKAATALGCNINKASRFDRKNYFYPDLPKGYQITQFFHPIAEHGFLTVKGENGEKRIRIARLHIEEDAGKLIHENGISKADFNRCGVPLIEIVTEPDMSSADEAIQFLKKLRLTLLYTGVSDCRMNEGSLRCDVNLSVRKKGTSELGNKVEVKNINSFQFAKTAMEYEFERQTAIIENGGSVEPETRRFDEKTGTTISMRKKENAADYRYFPEPDLGTLSLTGKMIEEYTKNIPMLPDERTKFYTETYSLSEDDAMSIISEPEFAFLFDRAAVSCKSHKTLVNLITTECFRLKKEKGSMPESSKNLAVLSDMMNDGEIGSTNAKKVLSALWESSYDARAYAKENNLLQINSKDELIILAKRAIEQNPKSVNDYKAGKEAALKALIGKVMAETGGRANALILTEILIELIK